MWRYRQLNVTIAPDVTKPSTKRQHELMQAFPPNPNVASPLKEIKLKTLGEVLFTLLHFDWSGGLESGNDQLLKGADWFMRKRAGSVPANAADLSGVDLQGTDLRWINLRNANLTNADLRAVDLRYASLMRCQLTGALLHGTHLGRDTNATKLIDIVREAELQRARRTVDNPYAGVSIRTRNELLWIFRREQWSDELIMDQPRSTGLTNLCESDLSAIDLNGVDLKGATLIGAKLISEFQEKQLLSQLSSVPEMERYPCAGITLQSRNELLWIMEKYEWSGNPDPGARGRPNLRGVILKSARLRRGDLEGAHLDESEMENADLRCANLSNATLRRAVMSAVDFREANLSGVKAFHARFDLIDGRRADFFETQLNHAKLVSAKLNDATLSVADLSHADCRNANLEGADLRGASVNAATSFIDVQINQRTCFGDIVWVGFPLTQIAWSQAPTIGDELKTDGDRQTVLRNSARAYRNLSTSLRQHGLFAPASRYRLKEKRIERRLLWKNHNYFRWLISLEADIVSGYGEVPVRLFLLYLLIIPCYSVAYYFVSQYNISWLPGSGVDKLSSLQSLALSVTLFEGHTKPVRMILSVIGATETFIGAYILLAFTLLRARQILGRSA